MSRRLEHDWYPEPLPANVELGERSWLYSTYAFRHYQSQQSRGLVFVKDTGHYNGTFFDLGPRGQVVIGDFCTVVGAIFSTNAKIVVRDYALIAHEVVLADTAAAAPQWGAGSESTRSAQAEDDANRESIFIGENAWIAMRAVLLSGARIGEGAIVGAAAVVDFEVPPYSIVAGNPARIVSHIRRP